jgi:hypothetical protein
MRPVPTLVAGLVLGAAALVVGPFGLASTAVATVITNPALHPYPITVKIDGQTYNDGLDTLPGYDDYTCDAIPDVQYNFADNQIFYYDDQGDLLAVAPWTEWSRISSYQTWVAQQQAVSNSTTATSTTSSSTTTTSTTSGSTTSGSTSSSPATSGSSSSNSGSSGSSTPASSVASSSSAGLETTSAGPELRRGKVRKVAGVVAKAPTVKTAGKYRVTVSVPTEGLDTASGKLTLKVRDGSITKILTGELVDGLGKIPVPKLSRGTWKVTISWPGDANYLSVSAIGAPINVTA